MPSVSLYYTTPHTREVLKTSGYALGFNVPYATLPNPPPCIYRPLPYPTLENLGLHHTTPTLPHHTHEKCEKPRAMPSVLPYPTLPLRTSGYALGFTLLYHTTPTRSVKNLGLRPLFYCTLPYPSLPLRTSGYALCFTLLYHTTPTRSIKNLGLCPRFYCTLLSGNVENFGLHCPTLEKVKKVS